MSVDTVARFTISLAANPEQLSRYRESQENRLAMIKEFTAEYWPLTDNEKIFLGVGNFDEIFKYLDENRGIRGITEEKTGG